MSFLNVALDTYGALLTKEYGVGMTTWEINLIRFGFAGVVLFLVSGLLHVYSRIRPNDDKEKEAPGPWYSLPRNMPRRSWLHMALGVLLVTFLTPALSNFALFQIALALALTLGSVGPLYALPLTWWLQEDRPTLRACFGAALAVAGIVILSLWGTLKET